MPLTDADRLHLLEPRGGRLRTVIDTDTFNEIDDQFAIVQALLSPDRLKLEGLYAAPFFNARSSSAGDGMELSYQEILRVVERLNVSSDGLVYRGVADFVGPAKKPLQAPAVDDLIRRARQGSSDEPLHIVAIAALSNIASAILLAPDIVERMVVVWLGGHSLEWPDQKEFNLRQDIAAAQVVLDSGVPLVVVPCMGVTSHLLSTVDEVNACVRPYGEIGAFLASRFADYLDGQSGRSKEIWDMAAVAYLLDRSWTPSVLVQTPILTDGATYSFDRSRHFMRYVTFVRRDMILGDFFTKLQARSNAGHSIAGADTRDANENS